MPDILTYPLVILWLFTAQTWGGHMGLFSGGWVPHEVYYGMSKCLGGEVEHRVLMALEETECRHLGAPPPLPLSVPVVRFAK